MNKITIAALALTLVQIAVAQSYTLTAIGVVHGGAYCDPYAIND